MSLSFYQPTDGFFERAHPVVKLLCLLAAFVPPFLGEHPFEVMPYFLFLFLAAFMARAGRNILKIYKLMIILFIMSLLLWTIFHPGQTRMISLGSFHVHKESVLYGITIGLRLNCFMLAAVIFAVVTICNLISNFQTELWSKFWHFFIWLILTVGIVTTIWFTVGGLFDLRKMFQRLGKIIRDDTDDGTVQ